MMHFLKIRIYQQIDITNKSNHAEESKPGLAFKLSKSSQAF